MLTVVVTAACLGALAFVPLTSAALPLLNAISLIGGAAAVASTSSAAGAMALAIPNKQRGAVAGWAQAGSFSGTGVGGGVGLWLAVHGGGPRVAALTLAAACVLCALPMLRMRVPSTARAAALKAQAGDLGRRLWALLRTRQGILVCVVVLLPACLGAASNLFAAVAADWHASANVVAVVTGVLGGLVSVPGCIVGGYLSDRFPRRTVYVWVALANAGGEALMAWAPHTPVWFAGMGLTNAFLLGMGYSTLNAIIYECLGEHGAVTVFSVLSSLGNLPVLLMMMVVAWVQTRHGSTAMLLTEAGIAVVALVGYVTLVSVRESIGAVSSGEIAV